MPSDIQQATTGCLAGIDQHAQRACEAPRTLHHAISCGRPAMLVLVPVTSTFSAGCHDALRLHRQARGPPPSAADLDAADLASTRQHPNTRRT